jgi:hypothetical protein
MTHRMLLFYALGLLACGGDELTRGVYRSGPNAISRSAPLGEHLVWGPAGTARRIATAADGGAVWLGEAGGLWIVDREVAAPPKATPVAAALVERAGFRMREVLQPAGANAAATPDAARSAGVYVRSVVKVRQRAAPPVYVVSATGDEVGAGRFGGPEDVRSGAACRAAVAVLDDKAERVLSSHLLPGAERTCAVPTVLSPVDLQGDGGRDILVHGQRDHAGFRAWFELADTTLVVGPAESWEEIP